MSQHRRALAVLFCDLVGSTELTFTLGAERVDTLLKQFRRLAVGIVDRNGGHVARSIGDGILAYFGYPRVEEDDCERAIRASLEIIEALKREPSEFLDQITLQARVGIAFGDVVVTEGEDTHDRPEIVGDAANLAARLVSVCDPNAVTISDSVLLAARGRFEFRRLEAVTLKGFPGRQTLHQVVAERARGPLGARSPMIGRSAELAELSALWARTQSGQGATVLMSGEAGIGKSRLAAEMARKVVVDGGLVIHQQCAAHRRNSDFFPLRDLLRKVAGIGTSDTVEDRYRKIERVVALSLEGVQAQSLIEGLAHVGTAPAAAPPEAGGTRHQERVLQNLVDGLRELYGARPGVMILEDAQWVDPSSSELLLRLVAAVRQLRLLIVVTARRSYQPEWIAYPGVTLMAPSRLEREAAREIARQCDPDARLSADNIDAIVERADGIPLFIEELTKAARDQQQLKLSALPTNVISLLSSRLDAVGGAKRTAQIAAALGKGFRHDVAARTWEGPEDEFDQSIERLMQHEVLLPRPIAAGSTYTFRHGLLQEAAYGSLLRHQRVQLHRRVADVLRFHFAEAVDEQPEVMAYHCEGAESYREAAGFWQAAGRSAVARGSVTGAMNCFTSGLQSARQMPPGAERERCEFELLLDLGPAIMAKQGYTSPDGLQAFSSARNLLHHAKSNREETQVLLGLFNVHFGRGELSKALEVGQLADARLTSEHGGYPVLMGQAHCYMGNFTEAHRCLSAALATYNPAVDSHSGLFCRADTVATSFLAKVEFALGRLDRSAELTNLAMAMAREQRHPVALAIAHLGVVFLLIEKGDMQSAHAAALEARAHAVRHELGSYRLWIEFYLAAMGLRADARGAITAMRDTIAAEDAAGTLMFRPAQLALLGAAYAMVGGAAQALETIAEGLDVAERTAGREAIPALLRLRAKLRIKDAPQSALADIMASLAEAKAQHALTEELRSATALAKFLRGSPREAEGTAMVRAVLQGFTQGHAYPDLVEASRIAGTSGLGT